MLAAIVTALKEELAAVSAAVPDEDRSGVVLLRGGVGCDAASRAAQRLTAEANTFRWVCSSGFSGGLIDGLEVGDIVIATQAISSEAETVDMKLGRISTDLIAAELKKAGVRFHFGATLTVRAAVTRTEDKRELGRKHGAIAVDMEAHSLLTGCGSARPLSIRVISDTVNDALPPEVAEFLDEQGNVRMGKVARFMLGGPSNMKTLMALKKRSDIAAASLTKAWRAVWPMLKRI